MCSHEHSSFVPLSLELGCTPPSRLTQIRLFSVPSSLFKIPISLKLFSTILNDTAYHVSKVQGHISVRDVLSSRPVGVFWWVVVAIHSVYMQPIPHLKGRFAEMSSGSSLPITPPIMAAKSVIHLRSCSHTLLVRCPRKDRAPTRQDLHLATFPKCTSTIP